MNKKKQVYDLDTEELLERLEDLEESTEQEPEETWTPDTVYNFVVNYDIRPGTEKVQLNLLYQLYRTTTDSPLYFSTFSKKMMTYVVTKKEYASRVALLNKPFKDFVIVPQKRARITPHHTLEHFKAFRRTLAIEPGTTYVASYMLYFLYKNYCRENRKGITIPEWSFTIVCKSQFKHKRVGKSRGMWFAVNQETADRISKEDWDILQIARTKHYGKKKKKRRTIPRLRPKPEPKN